jgi:hypothetical protein
MKAGLEPASYGPPVSFGDIQQNRRALAFFMLDEKRLNGVVPVIEENQFKFVTPPDVGMSFSSVHVHATHYTFIVHNFAALCTVPHARVMQYMVNMDESFVENQLFLALCKHTDPDTPREASLGVETEDGDLEISVPLHHERFWSTTFCTSVWILSEFEREDLLFARKKARTA